MKVICIKEIPIFSIKVGDKIDVNIESKSINGRFHEECYFINRGKFYHQEYPINKVNFITIEEHREQQLNKLLE
jgi:hypothetical protein